MVEALTSARPHDGAAPSISTKSGRFPPSSRSSGGGTSKKNKPADSLRSRDAPDPSPTLRPSPVPSRHRSRSRSGSRDLLLPTTGTASLMAGDVCGRVLRADTTCSKVASLAAILSSGLSQSARKRPLLGERGVGPGRSPKTALALKLARSRFGFEAPAAGADAHAEISRPKW